MQEKNKYKTIYFTRVLGEFIFYIYLPLFLKSMNYSGTMIGTILSFSPLLFVIALPVWNKAEGHISRKMILIIAAALTVTLEYFLVIPSTFLIVAGLTVIYSFVRAPLYPSLDSMITIYAMENNYEFSSFRAWGSFGYLIAVGIGGFIYGKIPFVYIVVISTIFMGTMIFTSYTLKPLKLDQGNESKKGGSLKLLIKNPFFVKFIIVQILLNTAMNMNTGFDILYLESRGFPTYIFGLVTVGRVSFEILQFKIISRFNFSYKTLFATVPVLLIIQSILYFMNMPVYFLLLIIVTTGSAVGILIYLNNKYVAQIVRPRNFTLATYVTAIVQNLTAAIMTILSGYIMDKLGANYIYLTSGIFFLTAFAFITLFVKKTGKFTVMKYYD